MFHLLLLPIPPDEVDADLMLIMMMMKGGKVRKNCLRAQDLVAISVDRNTEKRLIS